MSLPEGAFTVRSPMNKFEHVRRMSLAGWTMTRCLLPHVFEIFRNQLPVENAPGGPYPEGRARAWAGVMGAVQLAQLAL